MVTPVGFEPTTFRSGGERSNPLSYGATRTWIIRQLTLASASNFLGRRRAAGAQRVACRHDVVLVMAGCQPRASKRPARDKDFCGLEGHSRAVSTVRALCSTHAGRRTYVRGGASRREVLPMEQFFLILAFLTALLGLLKAAIELVDAMRAHTAREDGHADARSARHLSHK